MKLSIIIVSYNTRTLLQECLQSVHHNKPTGEFEIFVVDNASTDGSGQMVRQQFPQVRLIQNAVNIGFAAANNQAILQAQGEYLLLLNPDTRILDDAFDRMIQFMDNHPQAAGVGCKLLNPDGTLQPSSRSFPNLVHALVFAFALYKILPSLKISSNRIIECWDHASTRAVDCVLGAALMVRRTVIEQVGLLDPSFFLYAEEKDWCYRMWQAGYRIFYLPEARIIHYGGKSSQQVPVQSLNRMYEGQAKFVSKHYSPAYGLTIYSLVFFGLLIRTFIWWGLALVPTHKHATYREKAIAHTIVTGKQLAQAGRSLSGQVRGHVE